MNDTTPKEEEQQTVDLLDYDDRGNIKYMYVLQMQETPILSLFLTVKWTPTCQQPVFENWFAWFAGKDKVSDTLVPLLIINTDFKRYTYECATILSARNTNKTIELQVYPLPGARFALKKILSE